MISVCLWKVFACVLCVGAIRTAWAVRPDVVLPQKCGSMKAAHPLGDDTHAVVTPHTGHLSTDFTRSETRLSRLLFFEIVVSHPVRSGVSGGEPLGQRRGIERGCGHRESVDSIASHCPATSAVTACLPAVWPETVAICERSCSFRR